jgi:long-chain acyl-CoA synthetase
MIAKAHVVLVGLLRQRRNPREAFQGGWFHSGDLGRLERDGPAGQHLLTLTGRIKSIVKIAGEGVSLDEIDRVVLAVPEVHDAASFAIDDDATGEAVAIVVSVAEEGTDRARILEALRETLPASALPKHILYVDEVPRLANGKVSRPLLQRCFQDRWRCHR